MTSNVIVALVALTAYFSAAKAEDVFCGSLTIHKQQFLVRATATISSQITADLKECLNICCSIPNCNAVTFMGFISNSSREAASTNCVMFSCGTKCVVVDRPSAAEGVVSVIINKTRRAVGGSSDQTPLSVTEALLPSTADESSTATIAIAAAPATSIPRNFPRPSVPEFNTNTNTDSLSASASANELEPTFGPSLNVSSSTISSTQLFLLNVTPVWAIGLAIVIAVICTGLGIVSCSAFCCYRRHKNRMRSETFTHVKAPTLHAFNPAT